MEQALVNHLQRMEADMSYLQEQFNLFEQTMHEMKILLESLNELEKNNSQELLVNIGRRLYVPVSLKEKSIIVDVGKNTFVKKNIPETKKIIDEQLINLMKGKGQIMEQMNALHEEIEQLLNKIESFE
ncbi:MAG: prefoldin subunit alpha [Nanoarchaeota archaeon]